MADSPTISYRATGSISADRLIAVVRTGAAALDDPLPGATGGRDIRVLLVRMPLIGFDDPEAFGGETPDEEHAEALIELLRTEGATPEAPIGLVGVGEVGWRAIAAAAALGGIVDRLALVAVAPPETSLDREDAAGLLSEVTAKTLIMNGRDDDQAPSSAASWLKKSRGDARVEMVPREGRLALSTVWDRVLTHVAPGTKAR
jgi:hypothetical protein